MFGGLHDFQGHSGLADLGCGCASPPVDSTASGFDLSSIPLWVWLVGAGAAFLFLSKKQGR